MRTTLTLDDDISAKLKREMRRSGKSFKETVNDFLRLGLNARREMEACKKVRGPMRVGWVSVLAFLRISTDVRIPGETFLMAEALSIVHEWLAQPKFDLLGPGERHGEILSGLLAESQSRGALVTESKP